ncbi:MarR family winged helix-turn-helix transcriptional regulator [Brevibacillus choshinensis]|uniref:MarR family winged helix-turn-helix transcriptional regulator n=1 Tax=Brevibacillus choshinensis TaxID=54911 RepID=UPI002E228B58|nr:MarR family transcriptional regulator [Brevibacillus choshinensis]MED4779357.1 MarR family transcriptional regulator [Brevibacillus choshinensis]
MKRDQIMLLRSTVQQFIRLFGVLEQTVTPCGFSMSLSQVFALQELENRSMSIKDLADKLRLERSSVSRLVDGLVKGGFVSRELNEQNRREVILYLTEKGEQSTERLREQSIEFYESILKHLPETSQEKVLEGYQLFTASLAKFRGEIQ